MLNVERRSEIQEMKNEELGIRNEKVKYSSCMKAHRSR